MNYLLNINLRALPTKYSHTNMQGFLKMYHFYHIFKGLIIPGHILLSDKNPKGNVTKTHEGALLQRVFGSHFREGFGQTAIYHRE